MGFICAKAPYRMPIAFACADVKRVEAKVSTSRGVYYTVVTTHSDEKFFMVMPFDGPCGMDHLKNNTKHLMEILKSGGGDVIEDGSVLYYTTKKETQKKIDELFEKFVSIDLISEKDYDNTPLDKLRSQALTLVMLYDNAKPGTRSILPEATEFGLYEDAKQKLCDLNAAKCSIENYLFRKTGTSAERSDWYQMLQTRDEMK
jgi:hypothetical protein